MLTLQVPGGGHDTLGVIAVGQDRNLAVGKDLPSQDTYDNFWIWHRRKWFSGLIMHLQVCPLAVPPENTPAGSGIARCRGEDFMQVGVSNFTKQPVLRIFMNKKKKNMCIFIDVLRVRREI